MNSRPQPAGRGIGPLALVAVTSLLMAPVGATAQAGPGGAGGGPSPTVILGGDEPAVAEAPAVPGHTCTAPPVPEQFESSAAQDAFADQAEVFRRCIRKYAAEHAALSKAYGEASNRATNEWNRFAATAARIKPASEP